MLLESSEPVANKSSSLPPLPSGPPPPLPGSGHLPPNSSSGGLLAPPLPPPPLPPGPPPPLHQGPGSSAVPMKPSMMDPPGLSSHKSVLEVDTGITMPSIRPSPAKMRDLPTSHPLPEDNGDTIPSAMPASAHRPYRIQMVTWNMNKTPPTEPLPEAFLCFTPGAPSSIDGAVPDLVVVATQESGPLPALSAAVERSLGAKVANGDQASSDFEQPLFEHVATETLWDISITIYRHKSLSVQVLRSDSIATGVGNVLGNKGAVGVGLLVDGSTRLLLINSHFAAHDDKVAERNADYTRIIEGLFSTAQKEVTADYDVTVWAGDFNYRVNSNRRAADVLIQNEMWEVMEANEQLKQERAKGNAFKGFEEGELHFAPTFKYDPGTDDYDTSYKARVPSWTDRVLWKCNPATHPGSVSLLHYSSVPEMRESDHRPVTATLEVRRRQKAGPRGGASGASGADDGGEGDDDAASAAADNSSKMCIVQ